jgi:glycine betaine/proline transport system permease protein
LHGLCAGVPRLRDVQVALDQGWGNFIRAWGDGIEMVFTPLLWLLVWTERGMLLVPWWPMLKGLTALVWALTHSRRLAAGVLATLTLIGFFGMWTETIQTLSFISVCTAICIVFGIPIGIAMANSDRLRAWVTPMLNFLQTMPSFVYLIPVVMMFGIGKVAGAIAVIVYAIPPVIRLTDLGIRGVDRETVESFEISNFQKLVSVQIPLAMPTIMAGINQTIMASLAMVVVASMVAVRTWTARAGSDSGTHALQGSFLRPGCCRAGDHLRPGHQTGDQPDTAPCPVGWAVMPGPAAKIEVRNLYKVFGAGAQEHMPAIHAGLGKDELLRKSGLVLGLSNINFSVNQGQIYVIMGLSGSGKSTLVRHLNRLIEPTSGEVVVDGQDVLSLDKARLMEFRRTTMAMVFRNFGLLSHRTVLENVRCGLDIRRVDPRMASDTAMEWIRKVGLSGFEGRYPAELSGGMRQRIGLARALANDTDVLLMDEAFSG